MHPEHLNSSLVAKNSQFSVMHRTLRQIGSSFFSILPSVESVGSVGGWLWVAVTDYLCPQTSKTKNKNQNK
jgi:hypothetical protein